MEITRKYEYGEVLTMDFRVELEIHAAGRAISVDLTGPRTAFGGTVQGSKVNWPGVGSVDAETAAAFAELVAAAAAEAERMDSIMAEFLANHED
jgi:hypothetical protein